MTPDKKAKEIKSGAYTKDALTFNEAQAKKSVIPYEEIITALKAGNVYVMPSATSKHTIAQALRKLRKKHDLPNAKLGWTKDTAQRVFYV